MTGNAARFLLSADDYALSPGVSAAIEALAAAGRLSATTAMTTTPTWARAAAQARGLRRHLALGLHLNLTLGPPLSSMPRHAPDGSLPPIGHWIGQACSGRLDIAGIEAEISAQLDRFEEIADAPPDLVDGHHHVHALPGIRGALARVIARRYRAPLPLLRVPSDRPARILARRRAAAKALGIAALSAGAARTFHAAGAPTNDGFAGFSAFDRAQPFGQELAAFTRAPGSFHLVMCHPGHMDAELARLDPVCARREEEFAALMGAPDLPARLHHPARSRDAEGRIDWRHLGAR